MSGKAQMSDDYRWLDELPRPIARYVVFADTVSEWSGKVFSWLVIPLMLGLVYEVTSRYVFSAPTLWAYDMTYMLYGALFMLLTGYTLRRGGHIRTDFVYRLWPAKWQGIVDALLYVVFFLPAVAVLLWVSMEYTIDSWAKLERAAVTPWMPPIYPLKTVVPVSAVLLLIQGLAELVRAVHAARTGKWP